ncbi:MAG: FtsW/RodA/SpoVE family cell cycle protein [Anaerolineae bacterium]|nr:FtsW/RodA/SpoVE family cell cycle protein [Anaerolineae bacterium]MCO5196886.1 FtsW/RodA/SpoVE family cell cycle protein [Anaerolineae bacterium]
MNTTRMRIGGGIGRISGTMPQRGRQEWLLLLVAAGFVLVNAVSLTLVNNDRLTWEALWRIGIWLGLLVIAVVIVTRLQPTHDPFLLPVYGLLTGWGLLLQARLAPNFIGRQLIWYALGTGVIVLLAVSPLNLDLLRRYRYTLLLGGIVLLGATLLFGVNPSGYGAALWLPIPLVGSVYFQPSELLKLLIIIFFAGYFADRGALFAGRTPHWKAIMRAIGPLLVMWGFCVGLLIWQRDLGAAAIFFILFLSMLYLASGNRRTVVAGLVLLMLFGLLGYFLFDVVALRVDAWWNPWPDADDRAYQIVQSLYAIVNGGVIGQGIGQGFPTYIPVVHSDFAFAAVAEEWGLIGSMTMLGSFVFLVYRGMRIAGRQRGSFASYLAAGMTVLLGSQALLIMGGVTKLLPLTGVTVPFVSYGGSSFLLNSVILGLLLYLSAESNTTSDE